MQFIILLGLIYSGPLTSQDSLFFWKEVWQCVEENYVEINAIPKTQADEIWQKIQTEVAENPAQKDSILWKNIKKMIADLPDDYSCFIPPGQSLPKFEKDKRRVWAGLNVKVINGELIVTRVISNSPADKAGIKVGDNILKINGRRFIDGLPITTIEEIFQIAEDEQVILVIKRELIFLPIVFILKASDYAVGNLEYEILDNNILYLRIWDFCQLSNVYLKQILEKINFIPQGIILDLRDNPGGLIIEVVPLLSCWLKSGQLYYILNKRGENIGIVIPENNKLPIFQNVPTIVLVNSKTGSAAEIVVGALRDNQKAKIVGEKTFGKGSAYQVYELTNGAKLILTRVYWFTPNGWRIDKNGIKPDIFIKADEQDLITGRGVQFQKALEILKEMIK